MANFSRAAQTHSPDWRAQEAIQSWADGRGIGFSAALESLARIGLGQPLDEALAPALVSIVPVEIQRQMHRPASLVAANAIEAGISVRLSGAALRALRPKGYEAIRRAARFNTVHSVRRRNALLELSHSFGSRLEVTQQAIFDSISYGSRYQPEREAAQVTSLPEGGLIVISREVRHIVQDSRQLCLPGCRR